MTTFILEVLSAYYIYVLWFFLVVNVALWGWLCLSARKASLSLKKTLDRLVGPFSRRRELPHDAHQLDYVDAFLADIRDVVDSPLYEGERAALSQRMMLKDEDRYHLPHRFENYYGISRAFIEAFPLLGILGTVIAIAAGMQVTSDGQSGSQITAVIRNFGESVYCTGLGIGFAILFSLVNGWLEPNFQRIINQWKALDDLVFAVKQTVSLVKE